MELNSWITHTTTRMRVLPKSKHQLSSVIYYIGSWRHLPHAGVWEVVCTCVYLPGKILYHISAVLVTSQPRPRTASSAATTLPCSPHSLNHASASAAASPSSTSTSSSAAQPTRDLGRAREDWGFFMVRSKVETFPPATYSQQEHLLRCRVA